MATVDVDVVHTLISAGVKKVDAEVLATKTLTRDEAMNTLATKAD